MIAFLTFLDILYHKIVVYVIVGVYVSVAC